MNERLESLTRDELIRLVVRQVATIEQAKAEAAECRDMAVAAAESVVTLTNELAGLERRLTLELKRESRLVRELTRLTRKLTRRTRRLIALERESRRWQ